VTRLTILDLVRDPNFDPEYRVPLIDGKGHGARADVKPWLQTAKRRSQRPQLRLATACHVCGGAPYTPTDDAGRRVCGYCRGLVRMLRTRQMAEGGAA
jgi:hypothetical protein